MKPNIRALFALLLSVSLILCVLAGCGEDPEPTTTAPTQTDPTTTEPTVTQPTQPTEPEVNPDEYILFWNVDRAQYAGKGTDGVSTGRVPGSDDIIRVRFAVDGKLGEYKVASLELATTIDSMDLMTVKTDKNGVITEVTPYDEAVPQVIANGYFVDKVSGKEYTLNSAETLDGTALKITTSGATRIADVSGETEPFGSSATIRKGDKLLVIANTKGVVTNVFILSRVDLTKTQMCPHCQQAVKFDPWESATSLPTEEGGHFYLMEDVQLEIQQSMQAGVEVILDLNGKTVDGATGLRLYSLHNEGCKLSLMDSSEAQTGKLAVHGDIAAYGSCVWLRYGNFDLYSGTLDGSDATNSAYGLVHVSANMTFNMYGGTLTSGKTVVSFSESSGAQQGGNGGNVYVVGKFTMSGGTITGGTAVSTTAGEEKVGGMGGNVYVSKSGTFEMNGGTITGGTADNGEANVHAHAEATFTKGDQAVIG